jgi:anaerobic selenocysteine-containing dehydrogenase
MTLGRRDLIRLATGGACGAVLTPLPWKLLDDTANWSQNWSWTPKVPRGEVQVKFSTCTLCPAACGVKVRCVNGTAVGLEGATAHPFSHGVLCPVGFGGHTLAYCPLPAARPAAVSEIADRLLKGGRVALLDLGPERAMSAIYRQAAAALGNAVYLQAPNRQEATLNAVAQILDREPGSLGIDLEHTKTIVSFGAPVLEGWATPGRVMERWGSGELRVIQIEPRQSRTALAAQTWIPAFDFSLLDGLNIQGPTVVIGSGNDSAHEQTIAALNMQFGTIGVEGGIVARTPLPWKQNPAPDISSVPDHSIDLLFIDSSRAYDTTPWPVIQRKLSVGSMVVVFAYRADPFTPHATVTLPVAAPFEGLEDAGTPPCAAVPSFAIASRLIDTNRPTPVHHINAILKAAGKSHLGIQLEDELKQRAAAIHEAKKGTVVSYADGAVTKVAEITSADDLWKKLSVGACWMGEASKDKLQARRVASPPVKQRTVTDAQRPFTLLVYNTPDETAPLSTKLYQESGLYTPSALARMNPESATRVGLTSGAAIYVETLYGSSQRKLLTDPAVMPGVVEATGDIADICTDGSNSTWRSVAANVRRA